MNTNVSRDIAFFNLLKGLIAPSLGNESVDYRISISDLSDKMEMDQKIISGFLTKLQKNGLVDILKSVDNEINLRFDRTHEKLLEIISIDEIENKIAYLADFIENKISYFDLNTRNKYIPRYALEAKKIIEEEGENADLTDLISRGLREILGKEENRNTLNRIIFEIAKDGDEEDLKRLEEIIYYQLNLPIEENPFYVTLFLTVLSYQLQYL